MKKLTTDDPETHSADIVLENIGQLKTLFPDAFVEDKVDFDVLRQLLGDAVDDGNEKYGLHWRGKRQARRLALTPSQGTLRPCPEKGVDWDTTQNLMIEGDNLEVLKLLQKSYAGRVKMIYIDPPYNTGRDFVYPDDFQESIGNYLQLTGQIEGTRKISTSTESSGRFHTDWLNMMYPRLTLARSLLRPDGIIAVSIDDGEASALRLIMAELFGEENFLASVAWEKRYTRSNNAKLFYSLKDTLLLFRRSEALGQLREERSDKSKNIYANPDNDPRGMWTSSSYVNPATKEQRPNLVYKIMNPTTGVLIEHPTHAWKYEHAEYLRHVEDGRLWWAQDGDAKYPRLKNFLSEMTEGMVPTDLWNYEDTGTTDEGGQEVKSLFGSAVFDNPKPTRLVRRLLRLFDPNLRTDVEPQIVMDFFAGSGTAGHAVFAENAADDGKRRFILVQLPEPVPAESEAAKAGYPTIAALTEERLRRAAAGIAKSSPMFAGDLGFRVFKLASSNIQEWAPERDNLSATLEQAVEHLRQDRTELDILYELLLKLGLDLCVPIEKRAIAGRIVYSIGGGTLLTCLAERITADAVEPLGLGIVEWHKALAPAGDTTCVFRDSAFADDVAKTNLAAILQQHGLQTVRSL
jgi:adenine-specific DNA-methyltransferase